MRLVMKASYSMGLAPVILVQMIGEVGRAGTPIVLVEQTFSVCRAFAARHYILEEGAVVFEGTTAVLDEDPEVLERYLGMATAAEGAQLS